MARPAPQPRRNPLLPFYVILGVVALAGAFLLFRQMGGGGAAATELQPVVMTPEQLSRVPGISQGQPNAPVVVMEFADFQCPACQQFATFSKPLMKEWMDNGTVRFVWYDFPLVQMHQNAMLASRAGRCANEQNQFWTYHDVLFARQGEWSEAADAADRFIGYAQQAGLDRGAFAQCLRSDKYQKEVSESYQLGTTFGVSGTPTLFVNGRRVETPTSRAEWEQVIREAQGSAPAAPGTPAPAPAAADSAAPADTAAD
ncbi:MAG TPA: DsbA family protein [Longimicrobium sp.]|nr:DsbA family protein [Longimicrobium sp.]